MPATDAELRDLYGRYAPVLHHRCRVLLGSDEEADDAVQDTFARVIRHWDEFRGQASPLTWMWRISTNLCLNRLRDRRLHDRKHHDHRDDLGPAPVGADGPAAVDARTLRALIEGEDDETRRIVIHLYVDDLTREQCAELVGISVPTLRKRHEAFLARARRRLGAHALDLGALLLVLLLLLHEVSR